MNAFLMNLPAFLCMIVGFALLVVEMYIPGFGAPGISGTILVIAGVALKAKSISEALIIIVILAVLLCVALSISIHTASRGRLAKSKLVLRNVSKGPSAESDLNYFVGQSGVAKTILRPAGIAEFDGVKLNVVTEGDFIPAGTPVKVNRVEGKRIVVQAI
ncbi:MAG: hypothetical protein IKE30_05795 [Clostridia bacterium]|nr:hypothetical protein [Clostridia bacterium]